MRHQAPRRAARTKSMVILLPLFPETVKMLDNSPLEC